jgi:1-acyl-sn-glycerol-3-phosphate acyltransferase
MSLSWPRLAKRLQAEFTTRGVRFIGTKLFGFRIVVRGREHIPPGEPVIVAGAPHRNWIDGFLIIVALPVRPRVAFLASEHVIATWWKRAIVRLVGGFEPVSTKSALNREALQASLRVLARGERLGVFPEGWDHLDASLEQIGELRRGVAFVASQSGRRVLPVTIAGARPLWRGKTLRVQIGAPLDPPEVDADKAAQEAWSQELRAILQAQLPPQPPEIPFARRRWTWLTDLFN